MYEMHEKERKVRSYQWREEHSRPKIKRVWGLEREKSVWEVKRHKTIKRYRGNEVWNYVGSIYRKHILMDRGSVKDLSSTNSRQMNPSRCCRESVDGKMPRWIELLSRIYRPNKNFLNGLRIYPEAIETNSRKLQWIENAIRFVKKSSPRVSIDRNLSRAIEKLSSLIKSVFQRGEKHRNECN